MILEPVETWAAKQVGDFPTRWQSRLLGKWQGQRTAHPRQFSKHVPYLSTEANANLELLRTATGLAAVRLPLDASDSQICQEADKLAERCHHIHTATIQGAERTKDDKGAWVNGESLPIRRLYETPALQRAAMGRIALAYGIEAPDHTTLDTPAMLRMCDAQWWRRKLRAEHAKQVEGAAIGLGYVNKKADPYVSNESVRRRAEQNERNAAALEATTATNEDGQEFTLAELAAKGPANKAIRRAELMTRIAGFERIADDMGHVGIFMTMTAPSRMHKWTVKNGGVFENRRYDGTLPNAAQAYHAKTWARIRAKLQRLKIGVYGFRIAEPNHDGTPHWHCLLFVDPSHVDTFRAVVMHYALQDSGTERGALEHRVDWKPIDKSRGSAAGYIAKYVAKNIDGYRLDKDLIGNDAIETSHRVEAWASTWRIRQFQQIGGPPVGPWRELRRVKAIPANAPAHLVAAHQAVNKTKALDELSDSQQQVVKGAQWDAYVNAQGGVFCGRKYAIKVEKTDREGVNKYAEPLAPIPMGVSTIETYTPEHMTTARTGMPAGKAIRRLIVESARYVWTITRKAAGEVRKAVQGIGAAFAPWTRVNNCTEAEHDGNTNSAGNHATTDRGGYQSMAKSPGARSGNGWGLCGPTDCDNFGYQFGT